MRIGLISDTHQPNEQKTLWPEVYEAFRGVDLILHGGDVVHSVVLDWCEEIAPTLACRGNNDNWMNDSRLEEMVIIEVEGFKIGMVHAFWEPEDRPVAYFVKQFFDGQDVDVIISGDTHMEGIDYRDGVLQVNSGSPTEPHLWSPRLGTVGILDVTPGRVEARIVRLGETPGRKNPGVEYTYTPETGVIRHETKRDQGSARSSRASARCSPAMRSAPARSATVRATRRTRW